MLAKELIEKLQNAEYFADTETAYAVMEAVELGVPLLIEGDPGVGKTSLAASIAKAFEIPLIRVQCYDGIVPSSILYDYDYQRQLLVVSAVRDKLNKEMSSMSVNDSIRYLSNNVDFYDESFLLARPIYRAIAEKGRKVLLIDEIDKATEEIEHALLEVLSDFSITIPEHGTVRCSEEDRPLVILTSNRFRELSAALKRRCVYLYMRHKTKDEIKQIIKAKVSDDSTFCEKIAEYLKQIGDLELNHPTSISEGIAWARFLKNKVTDFNSDEFRDLARNSIGLLAKDKIDRSMVFRAMFGEAI